MAEIIYRANPSDLSSFEFERIEIITSWPIVLIRSAAPSAIGTNGLELAQGESDPLGRKAMFLYVEVTALRHEWSDEEYSKGQRDFGIRSSDEKLYLSPQFSAKRMAYERDPCEYTTTEASI